MKILGLEVNYMLNGQPIRTSAVDFYRLIQPLKALEKLGHTVEIRKNPFTDTEKTWDDVAKSWDVVFTNYNIDGEWAYVALRMACMKHKTALVVDLDDNIYDLTPDNPVYERIHKGTQDYHRITSILRDVPYMTVTNHKLQEKLIMEAGRSHISTKVLDNTISDIHGVPQQREDDGVVNIFYHGSMTHWMDIHVRPFRYAIEQVMREQPQVRLHLMGMFSTKYFLSHPVQTAYIHGHSDYYQFLERWKKHVAHADICVAPLENTDFTKCKSALKFYEYATQGKPTVASDVEPYHNAIRHMDTGYLAKTQDDWYHILSRLVLDKAKREEIGKNALNFVKNHQNIEKLAPKYEQILQKWVENTRNS